MANRLIADNPAALLWAGDVRMTGTVAEWALYSANYGVLVNRTLPTPGNHDYGLAKTGYNVTFKDDPMADTVTYCNAVNLSNGWQLFSINTYTQSACLPKLTAWLTATSGTRKIVLTHEPRFSGGSGHGSNTAQAPIWNAMMGHAFALVSGHDHDSQIIEQNGLGAGRERVRGRALLRRHPDCRRGLLLEVGIGLHLRAIHLGQLIGETRGSARRWQHRIRENVCSVMTSNPVGRGLRSPRPAASTGRDRAGAVTRGEPRPQFFQQNAVVVRVVSVSSGRTLAVGSMLPACRGHGRRAGSRQQILSIFSTSRVGWVARGAR